MTHLEFLTLFGSFTNWDVRLISNPQACQTRKPLGATQIVPPIESLQHTLKTMKELKWLLILTMIITLLSCEEQKKDEIFESVDCTFYTGYIKSIKVLDDGKAYMRYDKSSQFEQNLLESKELYSFELDKIQLDSISKMAHTLLSIQVDSFAELSSDNRVSFSIIVKSNNKRQQTKHNGGLDSVKGMKLLYHLVNYLDELSNNAKLKEDTAYIFESRRNLILPRMKKKK